MADHQQIIHAYRHLYRGLLHAVQFAKPARFVAQQQLRKAFTEKGATYDYRSIARTCRFLDAAAQERGLEHKVLKNLLRIAATRYRRGDYKTEVIKKKVYDKKNPLEKHLLDTTYEHYDRTIAMLNKDLGLCLR
ncbi:DUF1763-domain-containing protein [Xylariaceae sp. FL1272]|nr:DUF1763-domain-containing protein [Xylariaceae sp. FL1272]